MGYRDTTDFESKQFAQRVKRFRKRHRLPQHLLAMALGITKRSVVGLENCEHPAVPSTIRNFANLEERYERAMALELEGLEGLS